MQLVLTEDQELLAKTAADFVKEHSPVARMRALRDANDPDGFSRPLWKQMAELGWVGVPFPEQFGGAEMGLSELAVILEELGRTLAPEPFLATVLLGGQAVLLAGSEAQRKDWLEGVVAGEKLLALAQQERGSRFDLHRVATRAEAVSAPGARAASGTRAKSDRAGSGYRLSGEKIAVLDGGAADALIVVARTAGAEDDP
jgi:alkylation response protein AidB-like acyl-CoA dehydrogenase